MIFDSFWVCGVHGIILRRIVPNSYFGKRPVARDMATFRSHVGPHVPNIGYLEVYEGICVYGGIWRYIMDHPIHLVLVRVQAAIYIS